MIKNIQVSHSIAYDFIQSIARITNAEKSMMTFRDNDGDLIDKFKLNEDILKWIDKTKKKTDAQKLAMMDKYFNYEINLVGVLLSYINKYNLKNVSAFLELMKKTSGEDLLCRFFYLRSRKNREKNTSEKQILETLKDKNRAVELIEAFSLPPQRKWELLQACLQPGEMMKGLIELLEWYYSAIFKKEEEKVSKKIAKYEKELQKKLKKYGNDYLKILLNIDYKEIKDSKEIVIALSYYADMGYAAILSRDKEADLYIVGYRHMEVFVERKHGVLSNVHIFKALGDETRQNMIRLLAKKEWYGDELAQKMELSNSTVSYHLGILLLEGFVVVKRRDNKAFITLNKDNMKKIIDQALQRMLGQ